MNKVKFSLEAMDGDKAKFLRKKMDKAQFPWEAMNEDKARRRKRKNVPPVRSLFEYFL